MTVILKQEAKDGSTSHESQRRLQPHKPKMSNSSTHSTLVEALEAKVHEEKEVP